MPRNCVEVYQRQLEKFMSFLDGVEYPKNTRFTEDRLVQITPSDICRWLNLKAYGKEQPNEDDRPHDIRASTLHYLKKSISYFMPRKMITWDPVNMNGNPSKSDDVNRLIKRVKKYEVHHEGAKSQARDAISLDKFIALLDLIRGETDNDDERLLLKKFRSSCVLTMQWHLISRVDDMMKLKFTSLSSNSNHAQTLCCKMRWLRNITEEREVPEQIILGSMDPRLCPLLNLATYIELLGVLNVTVTEFVFGSPNAGGRVMQDWLKELFKAPCFKENGEKNLGTHSIRKGAATYCVRNGLVREYANRRGRWRMKTGTMDICIDPNVSYSDSCAASVLCGPSGPCKYVAKDGIEIPRNFLQQVVTPKAVEIFGANIAETLSYVLLWAAMANEAHTFQLVPSRIRERIVNVWVARGGDPSINPVERVPIYVASSAGEMNLVEMTNRDFGSTDSTPQDHGLGYRVGERISNTAVLSSLLALQRRVEEHQQSLTNEFYVMRSKIRILQSSVNRIAIQPVVRPARRRELNAGGGNATGSEERRGEDATTVLGSLSATLSKVRDLSALWREYEFGLNGRKSAKDFTSRERGQCKFVYCRRKVFWDAMVALIRKGYSSDTAIDKIYNVYGREKSVSRILVELSKDRRNGGHPQLR